MTEVYIMVGVAGSGKTAAAKAKFGDDYFHLSRDLEGGKVFDLLPKMVAAIKRGEPRIVLDCCFIRHFERTPFIEAAKANGATVHCIFFDIPPEVAQFNICWRMCERYGKVLRTKADYSAVKKDPNMFPPASHFKMYKDLDEYGHPSLSEGFTTLSTIKQPTGGWALPPEFVNKAIMVDYDGTVRICKSGSKYPLDPSDIEILPNTSEILKDYEKQGYLILGASNQSGIASNFLTAEKAEACFKYTNELIGVDIKYAYDDSPAGPISS